MADQSDGLPLQGARKGQKILERQVETDVRSPSRAPASRAQSFLQHVAQQASILPEIIRNLAGSATQSSLRGATAEARDRDREEFNGTSRDREVEKSPKGEVGDVHKKESELDAAYTAGANANDITAQNLAGIPDRKGAGDMWEHNYGYSPGFPWKDELPASRMDPQDMPREDPIPRIQAYAKLEFDDGEFYMNTYSVELGRDIRAARLAYGREDDDLHQEIKRRRRSDSGLDGSQVSNKARRDDARHLASSGISEGGGIFGVGAQDADVRRRSRGGKSKSTTSSSQQLSRKSSIPAESRLTDYQSLAMDSLGGLDPGMLHTSPLEPLSAPDACPLVPIHPPTNAAGVPAGHKSISRKHIRIAFNFEKRLFEVTVLGRNGAFVEEQYIPMGGVQPLKSGHTIQIGVVKVRFLLPDVAIGSTGADEIDIANPAGEFMPPFDHEASVEEREIGASSTGRSSEGEDFEGDNDEDNRESSEGEENEDDEEAVSEMSKAEEPQDDEEGQEDDRGEEDEMDEDVEEDSEVVQKPVRPKPKPKPKAKTGGRGKGRGKTKKTTAAKVKADAKPNTKPQPTLEPGQPVQKRKGPGRPPKNGLMSKREQALIARKAREEAKAAALKESSAQTEEGKPKSGTDVKQDDGSVQPRVKRKYTKRKSKDAQSGEVNGVRESTEHTDSISPEQGLALIPPKAKRLPKRPRSPSPIYDESELTPEQLAKPSLSYVVMIHEALSASSTGALSLSQIYRAIERRHPYYKFRVQTNGWQSSVRHNLSQHDAFKKIERDGKGWMWGLVPEVSIEKEKKRRPSPPTMQPQHYYQQGPPHMMHHPYQFTGFPPPNSHLPPHMHHPYGMPPGQRPPGLLPITFGRNGLPLPLVNAQVDSSTTYQSPYQSAPPVQPPQPQPPPSYTNGYNGYYPANIPHQPPPPDQASTNQPTHPTPSPTSYPPHPPNPSPDANPSNINPSNSSNQINQNNISTDVLQAVTKFKNALISSMDDKSHGESIVSSAVNRTLYPQSFSVAAEDEDPQEKAVMQALSRMLADLSKKTGGAHQQASQPLEPGVASSVQQQQPSDCPPTAQGLPPPQPQQAAPPLVGLDAQAYAQQVHQTGDHYPNSSTPSQVPHVSAPVQRPGADPLTEPATGGSSEMNDVDPAVSKSVVPETGSDTGGVKHVGRKRMPEEDGVGDDDDRHAKKVDLGERDGNHVSPVETIK
ncbi:hypothetical protein MMC07_007122 [Pseudocyphellaria aurata]|nr:hypothetical protein [Pseudocyphellaria aurata]